MYLEQEQNKIENKVIELVKNTHFPPCSIILKGEYYKTREKILA